MQSMSVRPEQVTLLAGQIRNGAKGIRDELDTLGQKVSKLRAAWGGEAQNSYDEAQRRWERQVSELQQLLERIAGKTEEVAQGYSTTDAQAAKRFAI